MKVSGFTLIRNGIQFDYPFLESFRSVLPLVDELVINVGKGDDQTLTVIQDFSKNEGSGKVVIFESLWPLQDPEKRKKGIILSEQTNLALDRCTHDWCLYLQADEVLHESDYDPLHQSLVLAQTRPEVEGLLFNYVHFYGSYDVIQQSRSAYRREVRMVRKSSGVRSIGDAQSFRKADGSKLKVIQSKARVFHYGWVRTPEAMKEKTFFMDSLYHGKNEYEKNDPQTPATGNNYRYKRFLGLKFFEGEHPLVMKDRIKKKGWSWDLKNSPLIWSRGDIIKWILDKLEGLTGVRLFEYKSYRLIK